MTDAPQISDAEWEVMNVLWERSPLTAVEVSEAVSERTQWHTKTVKTLLGRLVRKGALRYKAEGNRYLYTPVAQREKCVRAETQSFMERVFGGEATPMLMHFMKNSRLTAEEIDELRRLLDEKKGERT